MVVSQLIECVPNFSEAHRPEVVQAVVEAIKAVSGIRVLNVSSDLDHNRTVAVSYTHLTLPTTPYV